VGTGDSPQFTGIELGHATENTLTASSGVLSIEGVQIVDVNEADIISSAMIDWAEPFRIPFGAGVLYFWY